MTNISFNSTSLQTSTVVTENIQHYGWPNVNVKMYPLAHANQSTIPYTEWPTRTITINGTIYGTSIADCDSKVDSFKYALLGTDQNLDIDYNSGTRRYIATANSVAIDRPGGLTYALFHVEFVCSNPFGHDTSTTSALSASGRTANTYTDNYTFLGTAPFQRPITTITLTAVTGGTSQYISWGNADNGQAIVVSRTWANSDVLVIDSTLKTVTVNGIATAFTGAFPEFAPGSRNMQYIDGFATRTFTISTVYTVRYL